MVRLKRLAISWREEAEMNRIRYGNELAARLCEAHAEELERELRQEDDGRATLKDAAEATGFSIPHLRRLLDGKVLTNVGELPVRDENGKVIKRGKPMVLYSELPVKALRGAGARAKRAAEQAAAERARTEQARPIRFLN